MMKQTITIQSRVYRVGLNTAAALLELVLAGQAQMTLEEYDELLDALFAMVGEARNERYRFR